MRHPFASALAVSSIALALGGCPTDPVGNDTGTVGNDTGTAEDTGPTMSPCPTQVSPPVTPVPDPTNQSGACCYRRSQAMSQAAPEYRLRYIDITQPSTSPLSSPTVDGLLNVALGAETFNWLVRATGATMDGPVQITTGYGTRDATSGTYAFGTTMYPPQMLMGTIAGDTVSTTASVGTTLEIPIFDPTGTTLQLVLNLRDVRISTAPLSDSRSCIGAHTVGPRFSTPGQLDGYLEVATARTGMINVPPINSTLCSVVAGSLTAPLCDMPQAMWTAKPDSLCDAMHCTPNPEGSTSVCNPDSTCNAWHLVANFAAQGIDITP